MGADREALAFKNSSGMAGTVAIMDYRVHPGFRHLVARFECLFRFRCALHTLCPGFIDKCTKAEMESAWLYFGCAENSLSRGVLARRLAGEGSLVCQQYRDA